MTNTWGQALSLSIFGESHGKGVGIVLDGLPAGEALDFDLISKELARRRPGQSPLTSRRNESDGFEILSGLRQNQTTGAPLCVFIANRDANADEYAQFDGCLRPGHGDLTAFLKYNGHADLRGGGHFSGRLTAPLVFAGALAKGILSRKGVHVFGRFAAIAGITDFPPPCTSHAYEAISAKAFPTYDDGSGQQMQAAIMAAGEAGDSVGGIGEVVAFGVAPGLGEPFFQSAESAIAALLFSIPAVKAVAFGDGLYLAQMRGSEANDPIVLEEGRLCTASNHNGGILGGITNGMPLLVQATVKPTPSIAKAQQTVDSRTMQPKTLSISGRHDPCILPRALPALEAAVALCLLDMYMLKGAL